MSVAAPVQINVSFSKFVRYFVPGWFASSWLVVYAIRLAHIEDIKTASELLSFLHANWAPVIGMVLALGGFIGVCLVGMDVLFRVLAASRLAHLAFRYMLSSRAFRFPFLHFMDFFLMESRFNRLTIRLLADSDVCSEIKAIANSGSYERKCILRETAVNFFWFSALKDRVLKSELEQTNDFSSMFLSMTITSFLFFLTQLIFYIRHIICEPVQFPDILLVILLLYVGINLISNRNEILRRTLVESAQVLEKAKRKHYYVLGGIAAIVILVALYQSIYRLLPWFSTFDPLLLYTLFILFISMYWSCCYEYAHYVISYERELYERRDSLIKYIDENCHQIKDMIEEHISYSSKKDITQN